MSGLTIGIEICSVVMEKRIVMNWKELKLSSNAKRQNAMIWRRVLRTLLINS